MLEQSSQQIEQLEPTQGYQDKLRAEIARQTEEFLAKGGSIIKLGPSDPGRLFQASLAYNRRPNPELEQGKVARVKKKRGAIDPTSLDAELEEERKELDDEDAEL